MQAGRTTYIAGAQLWSYDGTELVEAGFHTCPEPGMLIAPLEQQTGGALTSAGTYRWRADLCYRNAQNEEVRSHSFFTDELVLTGGNRQVAITVPTCLTRRTNAYVLFYRNNSTGVQWYLANSRDPASADYVLNDLTADTVTWVDAGQATDEAIITREQHPANGGFGYLDQYSAPACEVIAGGADRIWLAGGEIATGQAHPSRLFLPGDSPGFNPALACVVDRSSAPITAIGFVGELAVIFHPGSTYIQGGFGPDNSSQGFWEPPRLAYSDVGAVSQESLALIGKGLLFQSSAGIRLLSGSGAVSDVGRPVDSVGAGLDIAGVIISQSDQEVRWYARSGDTLVYNYQYDSWSTWSLACAGVTRNPATGYALLASWDGFVLEEAQDTWTDNGSPYLHRVRFAWLRGKDLMDFQAVRRIGALGEASEAHRVHVDVYYDEREFAEEFFDWEFPYDTETNPSNNTDFFGAQSFGTGVFGDTGNVETP